MENDTQPPKIDVKIPSTLESIKLAIENELKKGVGEISVINFVEMLIESAYVSRASDLHLEPGEDQVLVRFRIDGILKDAFSFPKSLQSEVITRIKVLSEMKTDIHHVPQDGRFKAAIKEVGDVDVRVSVSPTYYGENVVIRILAEITEFSLGDLGFSEAQTKIINEGIKKPYGMILANGPTGSGKTTTLYTIIKKLNTREVSIITIEDPIEYAIEGINQIQVNPTTGLTFANGLRSVLRQDPDIIMVGEVRDPETAALAVNTALTGHLMLSTLHTNDAATTLPRLLDLGVEPYLISTTVNVVVGQRLVRIICSDCKEEIALEEKEKKSLSELGKFALANPPERLFRGKGCEHCLGSGYRGRIGIFEVMVVDEAIRQAILDKCSSSNLKSIAVEKGMSAMVEDGYNKALAGITTPEEVLRVIHE